jgi:hypothetical protein
VFLCFATTGVTRLEQCFNLGFHLSMISQKRRIFLVPPAVLADERSQREKGSARHTYVPNCALSHQAGNYENNTGIENDDADLHRQVDAKDFVFASRKALPTRGVAPPSPRVSQRMLTRTLRSRESSGLIARRASGSKPLAVEYSLTRPGKTIIAPLAVCAAGPADIA